MSINEAHPECGSELKTSMSLRRAIPVRGPVGSKGHVHKSFTGGVGISGCGEAKTCRNEVEMSI